MGDIYFFSYFSNFIGKKRNAPLASEALSLYIKDLLDKSYKDVIYVNLAHSLKSFCAEKNKRIGNDVQIGTFSFGKIYRKYIWKKIYWKKIFRFCKRNINENDLIIIYHSLYTNHLIKKIKEKIRCKVILIGAELYSDVTGNKNDLRLELESYINSNGHILISNSLKKRIKIERPSVILSGDYRELSISDNRKFSSSDNKIHLVYSGTFDAIKGGVYKAIDAMKFIDDKYVLHILGFGNKELVMKHIKESGEQNRIHFEGSKSGEDFLNFLCACDIGLSTQDSNAVFNNSSFPSKIINYIKCGLQVVSTPSPSLIDSEFSSLVNISNGDNPADIALAISGIKKDTKHISTFKNIKQTFELEFYKLVNSISKSKRILIVNNCLGGSTGNISSSITKHLLKQGHDALFCYFLGGHSKEFGHKKYGFFFEHYLSPLITRVSGNVYGYMYFSTLQLKRITRKYDPSLVNLHCINSYSLNIFKYLRYLSKHNIATTIVNHALFFATGNCGHPLNNCRKYLTGCGECPDKRNGCKSLVFDRTHKNWIKMKEALLSNNFNMISVSDYVKQFYLESPITTNINNITILNGVDTEIFNYKEAKFNDGKIHILYVSSSVKSVFKGFDQFLRILSFFGDNLDFVFHTVGNVDPNLKYNNLIKHGVVKSKNELSDLYRKCDLFLLTSKDETFSLPVAESLCCGTPVVGFKCGGPESFACSDYCNFYEFGDVKSICEFIKSKIYLNYNKELISKGSITMLSKDKMLNNYTKVLLNGLRK